MDPSTPKMGRNWSVPSVPWQAEPSLSFHLSCFPTPTPLSTFLPDSSGLYLPHCCPPCFNQVGGRDEELCGAVHLGGLGLGRKGRLEPGASA